MTKKKLVSVVPGEIYAIPLFLKNVSPMTRFSKSSLRAAGDCFCFMRVISDQEGAGIIVEVLDKFGSIDLPVADIVTSPRLLRPIVISGLSIYKKRWPRVGTHDGYNSEVVSRFSEIELVLSPTDNPVLWRGAVKTPISLTESSKYEPWTVWGAHQVERRILAENPTACG